MWRGYGANGHGAAIVFDTDNISESADSPLILAKVQYASTHERLDWIDQKLDVFSDLLKAADVPQDKFYIPVHSLLDRFKMFALFSKHDGFKEEQEWRMVYLKDQDTNNKLANMLSYAVGEKGIEPKLKLKIGYIEGIIEEGNSIPHIVNKIILGPSISNTLTLMTIKRMLEKVGKSELIDRVVMSSTPFRATV